MDLNALFETHLLSVVMLVPLAGAILLLFIPGRMANAHRLIANLFGFAGFLVSLPLIGRFAAAHRASSWGRIFRGSHRLAPAMPWEWTV